MKTRQPLDATSQKHPLARPAFIFAIALTLRLATGAIFLHDGRLTIDSSDVFTEGYEAVGVAQSLASGNGFSAPWPGAGPTAWLTPVLPAILAADMSVFGLHTRATLIVFIIFNEICSALTIFPVFFAARRIVGGQGGDRIAALAAWLLVLNPAAGVAAFQVDMVHNALRISWRAASVGHPRRPRFEEDVRVDRVRPAVGRGVDDASQLPGVDAGSSALACLDAVGLQTVKAGRAHLLRRRDVLRSLDGPQLRCVPPLGAPALEFWV